MVVKPYISSGWFGCLTVHIRFWEWQAHNWCLRVDVACRKGTDTLRFFITFKKLFGFSLSTWRFQVRMEKGTVNVPTRSQERRILFILISMMGIGPTRLQVCEDGLVMAPFRWTSSLRMMQIHLRLRQWLGWQPVRPVALPCGSQRALPPSPCEMSCWFVCFHVCFIRSSVCWHSSAPYTLINNYRLLVQLQYYRRSSWNEVLLHILAGCASRVNSLFNGCTFWNYRVIK